MTQKPLEETLKEIRRIVSGEVEAIGNKTVVVRVRLTGGWSQRQGVSAKMRSARLYGVTLEQGNLVIAGTKSNILERVRSCKEQILLERAS